MRRDILLGVLLLVSSFACGQGIPPFNSGSITFSGASMLDARGTMTNGDLVSNFFLGYDSRVDPTDVNQPYNIWLAGQGIELHNSLYDSSGDSGYSGGFVVFRINETAPSEYGSFTRTGTDVYCTPWNFLDVGAGTNVVHVPIDCSGTLTYSISFDFLGRGQLRITSGLLTLTPKGPTYSCTGFQSPFNAPLSLKQNVKRAIPLQVQLFDADRNVVTDTTIAGAVPVVNVTFIGASSTAVDHTSLLDAIGQANSGNSFAYDSATQTWRYNMSTAPYTASGTYGVSLSSGETTKYSISPTCSGTFVRQ